MNPERILLNSLLKAAWVLAVPATFVATTQDPAPTISGRVVDEAGGPIAGAAVRQVLESSLWGAPTGSKELLPDAARTGEDGAFTLNARGMYVALDVHAQGYAPLRTARLELGERTDVGTLVLTKGAVLEGSVVDEDGAPLPWANVLAFTGWDVQRVDAEAATISVIKGARRRETVVDAEGGFAFVSSPDVSHWLLASALGHRSSVVEASPGQHLEFRLRRTIGTIGGVLRDEHDEPVPGATVLAVAAGASPPHHARAETDAQGRFELQGLLEEPYSLEAAHASGTTAGQQYARPGEDVVLRMIAFATLRGTVVDGEGRPLPRFLVRLQRTDAALDAHDKRFDTPGVFELPRLAPGCYVVEVVGEFGQRVRSEPIEVVLGVDPAPLALVLPAPPR